MPRAAPGTPKAIANAMKAKGLQRLRWYCQVCQKQCRDDNGFKCHLATESHLRQMLVVGENAGKHISDFSAEFQHTFVQLLSRRFGTNRVKANRVYQEYIQDRHHLHMNSTRWVSLTEFVKHLGRTGVGRVDETDEGWFIAWIDNSPKALAKAEANQKKERATTSDEQRERTLIAEQIARANAEAEDDGSSVSASEMGLQRDEGTAPLKLSFAPKKTGPSSSESAPIADPSSNDSSLGAGPSTSPNNETTALSTKPAVQAPLKMNMMPKPTAPLKMNVFKAAAKQQSSLGSNGVKRTRDDPPVSTAQRLISEDQERKRRKMNAGMA